MKKVLVITVMIILLPSTVYPAWAWQIERPDNSITEVVGRVESSYSNGESSVGLGVASDRYDEGVGEYGNGDLLYLNASMTANSRMGIAYEESTFPYTWVDESSLLYRNDHLNVGDNQGFWANFPEGFQFRFYGAEYSDVWVSSNGFISFDQSHSTRWTPTNIPSVLWPNAVIAAVWTDFYIDSASSIITGLTSEGMIERFVIIWKNALHIPTYNRHTFQIQLEIAPSDMPQIGIDYQSRIWRSYKLVSSIVSNFAVGIEDHTGWKGNGYLWDGSFLGSFRETTYEYHQSSSSFFLESLTLQFEDSNSLSSFDIRSEEETLVRGYNIETSETGPTPEPDSKYMFLVALAGTATLLLGPVGGAIGGTLGGILVNTGLAGDVVLTTLDWLEYLDYQQYSNIELLEVIDFPSSQYARITAPTFNYVVDATLSVYVYWILTDPNNQPHSLTVTAILEYYEFSHSSGRIEKPAISTSVSIDIGSDSNDSFGDAETIVPGIGYSWLYVDAAYDPVDYYRIGVIQGVRVYVKMDPFLSRDFNLYLYNSLEERKASSEQGPGITETINIVPDSSGEWYIKVTPYDAEGFYYLEVSWGGVPLIPSKPSGPTAGDQGTNYIYSSATVNPDGGYENMNMEFDWGDGTTSTREGNSINGDFTASQMHGWTLPGVYQVKTRAQDSSGQWSNWSEPSQVNIRGVGGGGGGSGGGGNPIGPPRLQGGNWTLDL